MAVKPSIHEKASIIRDSIYAASDGVVTTFVVVAGAAGASLSSKVVVTLGLVSLLADGVSMASGNYLGTKSEEDYRKAEGDKDDHNITPKKHGFITFFSFVLVGLLPLLPYIANIEAKFYLSLLLVGLALFGMGSLRGRMTKKNPAASGLEMLLVGGFAAIVAYGVGFLAEKYLL